MSYILDALKKSDQERKLGHIQSLDGEHVDIADTRSRLAIVGLVALVLLAIALIGVIWHQRLQLASLGELTDQEQDVSHADERQGTVIDSTRIIDVPIQQSTSPEPLVQSNSQAQKPSPVEPVITVVPETESATPVPMSALPDSILQALPGLSVSVLSYSKQPQKRFVMLNNVIRREGDALTDNLILRQIEQDRLILQFKDINFFIRP